MAKRLFSVPAPLEGDEDHLFVSFCIPNTPDWRRLVVGWLETLSYGRAYDEQTGYIKGAQAVGREIFETMSMCKMTDLLKLWRMLVAAIVGEAVNLDNEDDLIPSAVDYTNSGLVPTLVSLLNVDRTLYPDMNAAEVLFEGLIGRRINIPIPYEGTGLADITDEQLKTLHNRFRMTDSSIFNPLNGEKNIVEALETQLRVDKFSDLEFLTPNIATVMNQVMKLENDSPLRILFDQLYEWITGEAAPPTPEYNTVAELLLLIAQAKQKASNKPRPLDVDVTCSSYGGGGGCCGGGGTEPPAQPGDEGSPPPFGYAPPTRAGEETPPGTPEYNQRKCEIAELLHDRYIETFEKLNDIPYVGMTVQVLSSLFGVLWLASISTLIKAVLSPVAIIGGTALKVAGWLDNLATTLVQLGVNLEALVNNLQTNRSDYVCALYKSNGTVEAITSYLGVAEEKGVNAANIAVLAAFLTGDTINFLFFDRENYEVQLERALDGYEGSVNCGGCGGWNTTLGVVLNETDEEIEIEAEFGRHGVGGAKKHWAIRTFPIVSQPTVLNVSVTGWSPPPDGCDILCGWNIINPPSRPTNRYGDGSPATDVDGLCFDVDEGIKISSNTQFTVTLTKGESCQPQPEE